MARSLEVLADIQLAVDGEDIDIRASGDHVVVDLPSLRAGRRFLSTGPFATELRPHTTSRLHDALRGADLSVELRLKGDRVAQIGAGAQSGTLARLFDLDGLELHPTEPLWASARRRPIATALVVGGLLVVLSGWLLGRRTP